MISSHGRIIRSWKRERTAEMTNARDIDDIDDENAIVTDNNCYCDYVANSFNTDAMTMTMMMIWMTIVMILLTMLMTSVIMIIFDTDDAYDY